MSMSNVNVDVLVHAFGNHQMLNLNLTLNGSSLVSRPKCTGPGQIGLRNASFRFRTGRLREAEYPMAYQ